MTGGEIRVCIQYAPLGTMIFRGVTGGRVVALNSEVRASVHALRGLKLVCRLDDASFFAVVIVSMSERERECNSPVAHARRTNGTARVMSVWKEP